MQDAWKRFWLKIMSRTYNLIVSDNCTAWRSQADIDLLGCLYPQSVKTQLHSSWLTGSSEYDNTDRAHRWTQKAPTLELLCSAEDVIWKFVLLYLPPTSELSDTQSLVEVLVLLDAPCRNAQTAAVSMGCDNCNRSFESTSSRFYG